MQIKKLHYLLFTILLSICFFPAQAADDEEEEEKETKETMYVDMSPAFVVNLGSQTAPSSYLKAEVQLVVFGENEADSIRFHKAPIRHELVMLLSSQTKTELQSAEAREALQAEALKKMNAHLQLLDKELKVEEVLFTTFIIQ